MVETTEATRAPSALERRETPALQRRGAGELVTDQGKTAIADSVVAKVAAIAAREIPGVYDMGSGTARAFGAIRERIPLAGNTGLTRGVKVEVQSKVQLRPFRSRGAFPVGSAGFFCDRSVLKISERNSA